MIVRPGTPRSSIFRVECWCRLKWSQLSKSIDMTDFVARLNRLDGCAVSDALDKLGLSGSASGLTRHSTDKCIAGRVVTYRLVPAGEAPAPSGPPRHLGTTAIEAAEPGDIIVVEQRTGIDAGSWGGIL